MNTFQIKSWHCVMVPLWWQSHFIVFPPHFWLCLWWHQCQDWARGCGGRADSDAELCMVFPFPLCLPHTPLPSQNDSWYLFSGNLVPTIPLPLQPALCLGSQFGTLPTCMYKVQRKKSPHYMAHAKWQWVIKTMSHLFPTLSTLARGGDWHMTNNLLLRRVNEWNKGLKDLVHCMPVRSLPFPKPSRLATQRWFNAAFLRLGNYALWRR